MNHSLDLNMLTARFHKQGESGHEDGECRLWIGSSPERVIVAQRLTRSDINKLIDDLQVVQAHMVGGPKNARRWYGDPPAKCEVSGRPITDAFVDGKLRSGGAWCLMHPEVHAAQGTGLGTGRGQRFEQHDGAWYLMEG